MTRCSRSAPATGFDPEGVLSETTPKMLPLATGVLGVGIGVGVIGVDLDARGERRSSQPITATVRSRVKKSCAVVPISRAAWGILSFGLVRRVHAYGMVLRMVEAGYRLGIYLSTQFTALPLHQLSWQLSRWMRRINVCAWQLAVGSWQLKVGSQKSTDGKIWGPAKAGVAQLVEQLIRNQQVIGSSPIAGSI
jgi:hypothetical protein